MLNVHGIIDFCCGLKNPADYSYTEKQKLLSDIFKEVRKTKIQPKSIQKWVERSQIPGERIVDLHKIAESQGKKLDLYKFIIKFKRSKRKKTLHPNLTVDDIFG